MTTDRLLAQLVAIDSRNPMLDTQGPGEAAIAAAVAAELREAGLEITPIEPVPGRPSLIARLPGSGGGPALLLNAHLDTVGFGAMVDPLSARVEGGRLYGRGSYDMKGGLAAALTAAARLAQGKQLRGDLIVTAVADEEHASIGTQAVIAHLRDTGTRVDGAIVTEPTDLQLCVAHKGFAWAGIITHGRAAHGSRRADGVDAIAHMGRVLIALEQLDLQLQELPPHPLLGHGSLHASLIGGGAELSTYPARCRLDLERRTLPGETAESVAAELNAILRQLSSHDPRFSAEVELTLFRPPLETGLDQAVVAALAQAGQQVSGQALPIVGATFWMDAALLGAAGIPTAIFGPRGAGLHADVEWVDLASVQTCADVLVAAARSFCG
ncbi:MAG TPA: M20/M25/M40 family metallo-hydrolase [Roseiflexaceae bacterium]|nr:M20/M25/M40 family metallo-hydrolase [Roseiflexaceae bacterium]